MPEAAQAREEGWWGEGMQPGWPGRAQERGWWGHSVTQTGFLPPALHVFPMSFPLGLQPAWMDKPPLLYQQDLEAFGEVQEVMKPIQWHLMGLGGEERSGGMELMPGEMTRTRWETFGVQWGGQAGG